MAKKGKPKLPAPVAEAPQPKPKAPVQPARHRTTRCEKCRTYLLDIELLRCDPGSRAEVLISLKCRNKKCKHSNQVTIDLENTDPPKP
jgi:hypothetical protein